jgi:predicted nuclease with TOPRIM domain
MTLQELNEVIELQKELENTQEAFEINTRLKHTIQHGSDGSRGHLSEADLDWIEPELERLTEKLECLNTDLERAKQRNTAFIATVPDANIRTMLQMCFVNCMMWKEVAANTGQRDKEAAHRKCRRYLIRLAQKDNTI